jgi:AraC-like DNA-binding protein
MLSRARPCTLTARLASPLLDEVGPVVRRALLQEVGLADADLEGPDARITHAQWTALWRRAVDLTRDPSLPLRAARRNGTGYLDVVGYLARSQLTVRAAHAVAARFLPLLHEGLRADLIEHEIEKAGDAVCRLDFAPALERPPEIVEFMLGWWVEFGRRLLGPDAQLTEVRFRHGAARDLRAHRRTFGCTLVFDAPHDEVVFPVRVLGTELPSADQGLDRVLRGEAQRLLDAHAPAASLADEVARLVRSALAQGGATMPAIAGRLGLRERTLRRRLREEETTYERVVDTIRRELALEHVAHVARAGADRSMADIAFRLGYSDETAFYRAFRRWTGTTPSALASPRARKARPSTARGGR